LTVEDLTAMPDSLRETELGRRIHKCMVEPIDVAVYPLFRCGLIRVHDDDHVLIFAMEHMITDGVSLGVLQQELLTVYWDTVRGRRLSLPPVPVQLSDYAVWQSIMIDSWREVHGAYWREHVAGCLRVRFPSDLGERDAGRTCWGTVPVRIPARLRSELGEWCRRERTTLVMGAFTAYAALVLRWCDVSEAVILFQTDGRTSQSTSRSIGYFASVLYLKMTLAESDTFLDLMRRVKEEYYRAREHADSAYMEAQEPRPDFTRNSCFNWLPQGPAAVHLDGLEEIMSVSRVPLWREVLENFQRDTEPEMGLVETDEEIRGNVVFPLDRFSVAKMERFARNFLLFIEVMLRRPEERVKNVILQ
jgi:hypothetical protein